MMGNIEGVGRMIDTVFSLDDFKRLMEAGGGIKDDVRICIWHKSNDQYFTKCSVIVSIGLHEPHKILRCIPSERTFSTIELTHDKKRYQEWTKQTYDDVEKNLGFKPIEGFWEWGKDQE